MNDATKNRIRRAVDRCARYCSREKAITIVAMNSRYSIAEVRSASEVQS